MPAWDLKLPCAQRPLISQHRSEQQVLWEVPPANCWTWQCFAPLLGQGKAGEPHDLATALIEKHSSSQCSLKKWLELQQPLCSCVLIVKKIKSRWPASQPANCQQCSFLRNQGGVRWGGQDAGTHRDRGGCTQMHMNTRAHTYQNEHAWAVTCARTHWYLSTSQSQNFSFFF